MSFEASLKVGGGAYTYYPVSEIEGAAQLPYSLTVLLENALRCGRTPEEAQAMAERIVTAGLAGQTGEEVEFTPARVLFQDFTGVPVFVDFAVMREACAELGGDPAKIKPLTKGGFDIDTDYSPAHLYELAKMDGAILISPDVKRIISANTHLMPDPDVPSSETGIRHRTAEQTARQTGALVICISQRRRVITLYKGTSEYVLKDVSVLLNTANQALGTLEKYKDVLEEAVLRLSVQEFDNVVTLPDVLTVVQRAELFKRVEQMLRLYLTELGDESTLIRMHAEELSSNVEAEERLTIRDYMIRDPEKTDKEQVDDYLERLARFDSEQLWDLDLIARSLGLNEFHDKDKRVFLECRGYRVLHKIPRLPNSVIENMVEAFGDFQSILLASNNELDDVEGIGPARVNQITLGLERIRSQIITDSNWVQ